MAEYELLKSEKNKEMLKDKHGHLYWKVNVRGERTYWCCVLKEAGKAVTFNGNISTSGAHNHLPGWNRVELKRLQGIVQDKAMECKDMPRKIIGSSISSVSEEAQPFIRRSLLARNIRNIRHEAKQEPSNPKNIQELLIPNSFKMAGIEEFLKYDGWNGEERVLIFSSKKCLDYLEQVPKWGCDGTFEVDPLLFDQLWILYVRLAHTYVPVVFTSLNRRLESSYEFVLRKRA
uniref:FLYWCH-type domain-containing protein n=1 Tax=Ditylenchus dipsaci TaxID=166011 RepID=A0A915D4M1_9BILA